MAHSFIVMPLSSRRLFKRFILSPTLSLYYTKRVISQEGIHDLGNFHNFTISVLGSIYLYKILILSIYYQSTQFEYLEVKK